MRDLPCWMTAAIAGSEMGVWMSGSKLMRWSAVLGTAAVAIACWSASGTPARAEDVIRFGAPLPLTGPLAPEGIKQQQGYDLWA